MKLYDHIIPVDRIVNKSPANLYLMDRPDLSSTFTKIALWKQTQFRRIVYLDSDVVALRAPDELFARESSFAAVPDIGWPDCFNSGVLALTPNLGDYYALLALAQRGISFDGADQGLLNMHFRDWDRLSFTYNCTPSGSYQYVPAYKHFQSSINMVHFIGQDKPWRAGRNGNKSAGAYEELLARWWAVYDKHFRVPSTAYISGQTPRTKQSVQPVQQYVKGEASDNDYGFSSSEPFNMELYAEDLDGNHIPTSFAEQPPIETAEAVQKGAHQGGVLPVPTIEQHKFSAPTSDWDPIREPPPTHSRPEAANFPNDIYTMSSDRTLYQAPKSYPEPPKDMWYQVPQAQSANERPKPIFPWEEYQVKPTRVFAEDKELSPEPTPSFVTDEETQDDIESPTTPTLQAVSVEPFSSYARTNAWDEVPEIERYIAALAQSRRAKIQMPRPGSSSGEDVLSPGIEEGPPVRRPSMKLTDFPTEFERPSLPVTPAPVRRPSFWGEERNASGDLPGAEGVPKQEDWDPMRKLEELQRKQSEVLSQGPASPTRIIPDRERPESAALLPTSEDTIVPLTSITSASSPPRPSHAPAPVFEELDFGSRDVGKSGEDEGVFGPTG
ncbi:glycogenin glucosyltransferase [Xylographa bjoerkii]|nr:glycogenin glucosyltransferase [Xylographa bjoerkii]